MSKSRARVTRKPAAARRAVFFQRKLRVNTPGDHLEQEADRTADRVMAARGGDAPESTPFFTAPAQISRTCDTCEKEEQLQRAEEGSATAGGEAPASVHETLRSPGEALDKDSRAFFEPRFGSDFSQVRIHVDGCAAESADAVQARAYTVGNDVVFGRNQYAPHTADGRHLLAHELTHTLQQRGVASSLQRNPDPPKGQPGLEDRLKVIEEAGPGAQARLNKIIQSGGPMPDTKDGAKVIGAAIIDVEGYQGPKEMRAINGVDGDALGQGAPVFHATTPSNRTLTATQGAPTAKGGRTASILGPRRESIFSHANDAEIKMFEAIISRLPKGAKGTIYFTTVRIAKGQTTPEPYPACSGCVRATFEAAGLTDVELVSLAPVHPPMARGSLGGSETTPDEAPPGKSPGGSKPPKGTDVEPPSVGKTGGTGVAIQVGAGVATVGLEWLAAYLKAKVDQKIAQRQIDAFLAVAKGKINANPDEALKKMMPDPYKTVYAWVHLESAVITTMGADPLSGDPSLSDSAPIFDLGPIEYQTAPLDPSLMRSMPSITGGGHHMTTVRTIIIDIPLTTPSIEDLISYATARKLPMDDLHTFAFGRYQAAAGSVQTRLDARQSILSSLQSGNEAFEKLKALREIARKRHDIELEKSIVRDMVSTGRSLERMANDLAPIRESIDEGAQQVKYWRHVLDLTEPGKP